VFAAANCYECHESGDKSVLFIHILSYFTLFVQHYFQHPPQANQKALHPSKIPPRKLQTKSRNGASSSPSLYNPAPKQLEISH